MILLSTSKVHLSYELRNIDFCGSNQPDGCVLPGNGLANLAECHQRNDNRETLFDSQDQDIAELR